MYLRSRWPHRRCSCLLVILASALIATAAYGKDALFTFDVDGVLPSSQGAVFAFYVYPGSQPPGEGEIFHVSGGVLTQDTTQWDYLIAAYQLPGVFDHSQDAVLEFRAKFIDWTYYYRGGVTIVLFDANYHWWEIDLSYDSIFCQNDEIPFNTHDAFHVYTAVIPADQDGYQVYVDGQLLYEGLAGDCSEWCPEWANRLLYWGDGSEGNAIIEWDYVSFLNHVPVSMDIKPGSFPNSINPESRGVIPVAILTTSEFDASEVEASTCRFGLTGTEAAAQSWALKDVDSDGDIDLIIQFQTLSSMLACGAESAVLTCSTAAGQSIRGVDSVQTVGCRQ